MTKQQHTPAPWQVVEGEIWDTYGELPGVPLFRPCRIYRRWGRDFAAGEQEANARLIAAAPELLKAAEQWAVILTVGIMHSEPAEVLDAMDALADAIAKARGETSHD